MKLPRFRFVPVLGALLLAAVPFVRAAGPTSVTDDGGFFSEKAKQEAVRTINEIAAVTKKDVLVETYKEVPAEVKQGVNAGDKVAVTQMFEQWTRQRAKTRGVNGVFILLTKEPSHLQIEVGNDTQKQAFTLQDRSALKSLMLAKLGAKQYDAALTDGVNFISATMRSHLPVRTKAVSAQPVTHAQGAVTSSSRSGGGGSGLLTLIVIGLVVWVVIGIVRAIGRSVSGGVGGAPMAPGAGYPGSGGGGGFFRSLLGGMFGAAAGMWMYDQFFGGHSYGQDSYRDPSSSFGGDSGGDGGGFTGQDTDYSGDGGSFGDSGGSFGGGGDFGGGGGGDFGGGGDSGGGGGDF